MKSEQIQHVGVIGAGVIGVGVAQILAEQQLQVVLLDEKKEALERVHQEIANNLRLHTLFRKRKSPPAQEVMKYIQTTTDWSLLSTVDWVIENTTERWDVKEEVFKRLDQVCPPHCILAANTSAIPILQLAQLTQRPEQVLGMHFMNPVPLKPAVEVIRSPLTSDKTMKEALALLKMLDKEGLVVKDSPGFVTNRVLMLTINEAIRVLEEDVSDPHTVDRLFQTCFGHKMGPLATCDLIGLDTVLYTLEVLQEHLHPERFQPCEQLKEMVAAGKLGQKSGQGFYRYPTNPTRQVVSTSQGGNQP